MSSNDPGVGTGRKPREGPAAAAARTEPDAVKREFDHEFDPDGLRAGKITLVRLADLIGLRSGRGDPELGDKEWGARRSDLSPAFLAAIEGELKLLRAQLYSTGLFKEVANTTGARTFDHEYDPDGLRTAAITLVRIADLIGIRSCRGDPELGDKDWAARRSDLPPAFRASLEGELKLLRAQLYSTGLFQEIVNVDLGGA